MINNGGAGNMRAAKAMTGAVLAVTLAAGCSGADAGDGTGKNGAVGRPDTARVPAELPAELAVPGQYDGSLGWDEILPWVPESVGTPPVTVVPRTEVVAMMYATPDGYTVQTKAAGSGKAGWGSAPWKTPARIDGTEVDEEIPGVAGVELDGRGYVIAYAHGVSGKGELHEGTEVVRLAVFPADASGSGVKPLREVDVPVSADPNEIRVGADGGRLLVAYGDHGRYPRSAVAVDVNTGLVTPYEEPDKLLPECVQTPGCSGSRVMAVTADGPLVTMDGWNGFGVPGRWFSDSLRPDGVPPESGNLSKRTGRAYGVAAGRVLASWDSGSSRPTTWSVHDARTGAVLALMECATSESVDFLNETPDHSTVASPSGRYLAAGPVAFDLERKQGICLAGDGDRKTIDLSSIRDDGTAYGMVDGDVSTDTEPAGAQVDLTSSGEADEVGRDVEIPFVTDVGGGGLFLTRDEQKRLRVSLRRAS
ncbi:hypothetical protein [Streptomyces sp. NPDC059957]|uniref:hypothetical protein n=1 Tax=unclassified Streptomyces TaxID=2593676 RepID=UPI003649C3BB